MSEQSTNAPVIEQTAQSTESTQVTSEAPATEVQTQATEEIQGSVESTQEQSQESSEETQQTENEPEAKLPEEGSFDFMELIQRKIDGTITEADKKMIEKSGLTPEQFEQFVTNQQEVQKKNADDLFNAAGGQQNYEQMKTFAVEHLNAEELEMYNTALFSGNMKLAKMAVLGLKAMYEEHAGHHPEVRISGGTQNTDSEVEGYNSREELIKDMRNNRYGRDRAFTAQVDAKRKVSGF